MMVQPGGAQYRVEGEEEDQRPLFSARRGWMCRSRGSGGEGQVKMANSWLTTIAAGLVWGLMAVMNVANLALLGKGDS